jgi:Flp pilus assembly protein TadG
MRTNSGQALIELALCAPIVLSLSLGTAALVQVEDASTGLNAATHAAVSTAARAPDPITAVSAAQSRFVSVVAGYPVSGATLEISVGRFDRATDISATSQAFVEVGWASLVLPGRLALRSRAEVHIERWRTHRSAA